MKWVEKPLGRYTRLKEASNGKDTMTGHWEMMGIKTEKPFKTFTEHGFPKELIAELEKRCGKKVIGNKSYCYHSYSCANKYCRLPPHIGESIY